MKYILPFLCVALSQVALAVERSFPSSATASEKAILDNITDQVNSGNINALYDTAQVRTPVAIQYLYLWIGFGRTPQQERTAAAAMAQLSGYADYLQQDIADASSQGEVSGIDFEILGMIGTTAAAKVAAPYLFDQRTISYGTPSGLKPGETPVDIPQVDNFCGAAKLALEQMNLPGSPKITPDMSNSAEVVAWQKWVIAQGLVPKEWESRVGAPEWLLRLDAAEATLPSPSRAAISAQQNQSLSPGGSTAGSVGAASISPSPGLAAETEAPKFPGTAVITAVILLLIAGGIFAWKRRS